MSFKEKWKKVWHFIWEDDSLLSWIVNVILAFVLVKFIIFPGLGLLLGTTHPVVAVVSGSMEHNGLDFDSWWENNKGIYENMNITKEQFYDFKFRNGFNKGDLMVLISGENIETGDVIVFRGNAPGPIIHRAIKVDYQNSSRYIQTKGDNNLGSRQDEFGITQERVIGKALFRIPYLGWVKLGALKIIGKA